jgi:hypothetical protein
MQRIRLVHPCRAVVVVLVAGRRRAKASSAPAVPTTTMSPVIGSPTARDAVSG